MNQQLSDYVAQSRKAGANDAQIRQALLSAGWNEQAIQEVMGGSAVGAAPVAVVPGVDQYAFTSKWSWGAFLMQFFYFLGSRNYGRAFGYFFGSFIPIYGIWLWIKGGLHGRAMVWESGKWSDFELYKKRQQLLDKLGVAWFITTALVFGIYTPYIITNSIKQFFPSGTNQSVSIPLGGINYSSSSTYSNVTTTITAGGLTTTITDKKTFTSAQLSSLKSDLTQLYLKYKGQDKNVEPLKTQYGKELDAVFLKDLGVGNVTTINMGVLFYPEIASIVSGIEKQNPIVNPPAVSAPPASGMTISNLNYTSISAASMSSYADKPLTFNINTSGALPKCMYYDVSILNASGGNVFDKRTYNDCYIKSNVYTDKNFFSNHSDYNSSYFSSEGIDHITFEFYVKDASDNQSNRLMLTITK